MAVAPTTLDSQYVHTESFDKGCALHAWADRPYQFDDYFPEYSPDIWDDSEPSISSIPAPYDVGKVEAHLYYFGLRGPRRYGPKLIYRTSKDVFTLPLGPEDRDVRIMQLLPVYEHDILGKDDQWATIRSKVVELLDRRNIQLSSVDLVRFSWLEENPDFKVNDDIEDVEGVEEREYADIKLVPYHSAITTPITIWIGVLPDTLTSEVAFHSSKDILDLLKEYGITDIDVAYRESVARTFADLELFAPASDYHDPFKAVIDPLTTALGLPIAGLKTLNRQGTMGFYFRVHKDLYAVTARHVLFDKEEGNHAYSYTAGPKKEVVLMGAKGFSNFFKFMKGRIGSLNFTVTILEKQVRTFTERSEGGPNVEQAARHLVQTQFQLEETRTAIEELKKLFVKIEKQWSKPKDRVIGYVVWAPPISFLTTPNGYTKDVCVVKLDEKKFLPNFRGNVLDLGPEIDSTKFITLIYPRINAPSDFDYPEDRLLKLRGILSAEEIRTPNNKDKSDRPMRYVLKHGTTTFTTIGCLTGFESQVRRYYMLGKRDSVEVAVCPYYSPSGPFCRGGDSGSIIVDVFGKFVALLTAGAGPTEFPEITYGSPMYWLWEVIKAEFPGANLYFEDSN